MKNKFINVCLVILIFMVIGCSSKNERLLKGKWTLAGRMVGVAPTSFWFKGGGSVIAPWEGQNQAVESSGKYEFIDDTHLKVQMLDGYYEGNIYFFEIINLDQDELIFRTEYQEIKLRRTP
ncbi:MAG: hypothetical protein OEU95_04045 [Nitrospirota bacterium]|nr:hypothetical protein [Nitrospirota bacterium]